MQPGVVAQPLCRSSRLSNRGLVTVCAGFQARAILLAPTQGPLVTMLMNLLRAGACLQDGRQGRVEARLAQVLRQEVLAAGRQTVLGELADQLAPARQQEWAQSM